MHDRLRDLNRLSGKKGADDDAIDLERGDKRRGPPGRSKSGRDDVEIVDEEDAGYPEMSNFFSEVASIKSSLKKMGTNVKALEEAYQDSLQKTSTADKKAATTVVDSLIDDTSTTANQVQSRLKKLVETTQRDEADLGPAESRIRKNIHNTLVAKFVEQMQIFQEIQTKYRSQFREQAKNIIKTANPEATEEQIEEAIEEGRMNVFSDQALARNQAAKNALAYVQDKHKEIIKIEQSLQELYQLFVDMAALVAEQSEMVNSIENNINDTKEYTQQAVKELKKANKLAKRSTRTRCILLVVVIIIAVVVAVTVGLGVGLGGKGS